MAVKALSLGPRGWWLLARTQWAILEAASIVRRTPRGELVERLASDVATGEARPEDRERVEAIGLAIDRVVQFGLGRPLCLVRSLALQRLLRRHGIPGSAIRVGVRICGGRFEAHAWVEWNGTVVGEDPGYVARFRPFSDLGSTAARVSWPPAAAAP